MTFAKPRYESALGAASASVFAGIVDRWCEY